MKYFVGLLWIHNPDSSTSIILPWISFSWVYISIYILHQCCIQALVCCLVHTRSCTYSSNWASTKFMTILDDNSSSRCETFVHSGQQLILVTILTLYRAVTKQRLSFSSPSQVCSKELFTNSKLHGFACKTTGTGDCVRMKAMHQEYKVEFLQLK